MPKKVTAIPATLNRFSAPINVVPQKRKVAGYARVSTDLEEQQSSYENQINYYTEYIKRKPEWEFAGIYTDEGITATSTRRREGFNRMVADAMDGKIDLIITKSISRFARNTVDSLTTIRKLKEKGIEIFFEKENIWTFDSKCELIITIMSSLAQEESRSISENTTWGRRKSFANGKASVSFSHFLGYDAGFVINEEEAHTVQLIYKMFLAGISIQCIGNELERRGIKTPYGKDKWSFSTLRSILSNEKYKGDALLQKEFTTDFLTKKIKRNEGEVPQYYVEGHHPAIIDPLLFEEAQYELQRRIGEGRAGGGRNIFSAKVRCGICGGRYGRKVWHSNQKYRSIVYQCNNKYEGGEICRTPRLTEDEIKQLFIRAVAQLVSQKDEVIANLNALREMTLSSFGYDTKKQALLTEISELETQLKAMIADNASTVQDQTEYDKKYNETYNKYSQKLLENSEFEKSMKIIILRDRLIGRFINSLKDLDIIDEFDENLWLGIVDKLAVNDNKTVTFTFIGGYTVTLDM